MKCDACYRGDPCAEEAIKVADRVELFWCAALAQRARVEDLDELIPRARGEARHLRVEGESRQPCPRWMDRMRARRHGADAAATGTARAVRRLCDRTAPVPHGEVAVRRGGRHPGRPHSELHTEMGDGGIGGQRVERRDDTRGRGCAGVDARAAIRAAHDDHG